MMNKRKACPTVSAAEQAKQEKHWTNGDSYNDSITETGKKQAFPVALKLKRGEKTLFHPENWLFFPVFAQKETYRRKLLRRERPER